MIKVIKILEKIYNLCNKAFAFINALTGACDELSYIFLWIE